MLTEDQRKMGSALSAKTNPAFLFFVKDAMILFTLLTHFRGCLPCFFSASQIHKHTRNPPMMGSVVMKMKFRGDVPTPTWETNVPVLAAIARKKPFLFHFLSLDAASNKTPVATAMNEKKNQTMETMVPKNMQILNIRHVFPLNLDDWREAVSTSLAIVSRLPISSRLY